MGRENADKSGREKLALCQLALPDISRNVSMHDVTKLRSVAIFTSKKSTGNCAYGYARQDNWE